MQFLQPGIAPRHLMLARADLETKIRERSAKLGVIGLGYVGLPLAVEMASAGFSVTGIDIDGAKVNSINAGRSYLNDVTGDSLLPLVRKGLLRATQSFAAITTLDTVTICVPTPLRKTKDPELSYVIAAVEAVRHHLRPPQLVILESTTYPGTTREAVLPILRKSGLEVGQDFFLAYSPERVDPGNKIYKTRNIPKVIGGFTERCAALAILLYQQLVEKIVLVSSTEAAEMVKLLENTFRSVNIALANEMALVCHKFGLNVWEVIDAAQTKPFGFMPFYPGPGLGGQCIPIDPYYPTWKAKMHGFEPRLIQVAAMINGQMPEFTVSQIADALNKNKKSLNGSRVLALGITYKRDVIDTRESPALEVVRILMEKGSSVSYSDPFVPSITVGEEVLLSVALNPEVLQAADCAVILTDHSAFDYSAIAADSALVLDCRNALKDFPRDNVICL